MNLINKYTHFVDLFEIGAKAYGPNKTKYLVLNNGTLETSNNKDKSFRTKELVNFIRLNLNEIITLDTPLENRIQLLQKLERGVQSYAERITTWTKSRWWFCILKCFGYPQCPKKITRLRESVQKSIKILGNSAAPKKAVQALEIAPKKTVQAIPDSKGTAPIVSESKPLRGWNKLKESTDMAKLVCSYLSVKDFAIFARVAKRENALYQLAMKDLLKKASELGATDIEIEIAREAGLDYLHRMIEELQKPFDEKVFLKDRLCMRIREGDYVESDDVGQLRNLLLKYWGATPEEIQNVNAESTENSLYKFLLKKWGFSEDEINNVAKAKYGLKKLVNEVIEAERCVKFSQNLFDPLENIIKKHFPNLLKDNPALELRIKMFNFLEKQKIAEGDELPIIPGPILLKVAEEIRKVMRTYKGEYLRILWNTSEYQQQQFPDSGSQLDTLPVSINLLKGLKKFIFIDGNKEPCCKKLPLLALPKLKELEISNTLATELPWLKLPELNEMRLINNRMANLPNCWGHLDKLSVMEVSGKLLAQWDEDTKLPRNLKTLRIGNSNISKIPKSIEKLKVLSEFGVRQYEPVPLSIPKEIAQLSNLTKLHFRNCGITEHTPGVESIAKLTKLEQLTINPDVLEYLKQKGLQINKR